MNPCRFVPLAAPLLAAGCASVYVPNPANIALHQQANDVHLAGRVGTHGVQADGAYAVTDFLAIRASVDWKDRSRGSSDTVANGGSDTITTGWRSATLGVGGYWASGAEKSAQGAFPTGARMSANLDVTGAQVVNDSDVTNEALRVTAQLDAAFEHKYFAAGGAMRVSQLWFSEHFGRASYVEPVLFVRGGGRPIKAEVQVGLTLPLETPEVDVFEQPFPLQVSAGVVFDF